MGVALLLYLLCLLLPVHSSPAPARPAPLPIQATATSTRFCDTELLLESSLFAAWGAAGTRTRLAELQARLDAVLLEPGSALHRLAVRVQVVAVRVVSPICSTSSSPASPNACLERFSSQLRQNKTSKYCLHYLATGTELEGGAVGQAWAGQVCSSRTHHKYQLNTGLVSFTNYGHSLTAVQVGDNMAHEIGHNLGAIHDQDTAECNSSAWLMSQSGSSGAGRAGPPQFSPCSQECLAEEVAAMLAGRPATRLPGCHSNPSPWPKDGECLNRVMVAEPALYPPPANDAGDDEENYNSKATNDDEDVYHEDDMYYDADEEYSYIDDDEYNIEAFNNVKEAVVRRNPVFTSVSKNLLVREGDIIRLPCLVDNFDGFVILWRKNTTTEDIALTVGDSVLTEDGRMTVETNPDGNFLLISRAEVWDEGEYTCQLSSQDPVELKHTVRVRPMEIPL